MDDRFGGLMDKQADSYDGKMSTLKDTMQQTAKAFMDPLLGGMKGGLDVGIGLLEGIKGWFSDTWPSIVAGAGAAWEGFVSLFAGAGDFIGAMGARLMSAFEPFQPVIDRLKTAWDGLVQAFVGLAPEAEGATTGLFDMLGVATMLR